MAYRSLLLWCTLCKSWSQFSNRNSLWNSCIPHGHSTHVIWEREHPSGHARNFLHVTPSWISIGTSTPWKHLHNHVRISICNTKGLSALLIVMRSIYHLKRNNIISPLTTCCWINGIGCCWIWCTGPNGPRLPPGRWTCWLCWTIGIKKLGKGAPPGLIPGISGCWKPNPGCEKVSLWTSHITYNSESECNSILYWYHWRSFWNIIEDYWPLLQLKARK